MAAKKKTTRKAAAKRTTKKKQTKREVGRPKKELSDLPGDWRERMVKLAAQGASDVELRVEALGGISNGLWYRLIEEEPEFADVVKQCSELCESWWMRLGREGAGAKVGINPTAWIFNMKNRFGWADKHEHAGNMQHSGPNGGPIEHKIDHSAGVQFSRIMDKVERAIDEERSDD